MPFKRKYLQQTYKKGCHFNDSLVFISWLKIILPSLILLLSSGY